MSNYLCSGIDLGDDVSVSGIFFVNRSQPEKSCVVVTADRNGAKFPGYDIVVRILYFFRASIAFADGERLSAEASRLIVKIMCILHI